MTETEPQWKRCPMCGLRLYGTEKIVFCIHEECPMVKKEKAKKIKTPRVK